MMTQHPNPEVLSAYLDGKATLEEQRIVDTHLATCGTCREHLRELGQTARWVHALDPVPLPMEFRRTVRAHLQQDHRARRFWPINWRPSWRIVGTATAVVLIGLFAINLVQQMLPPQAIRLANELKRAAPGSPPQPSSANRAAMESSREPIVAQPPSPLGSGRQVIRTAALTVEVRDVDEGARTLMRIAEAAGGFVANTTIAHQTPSYGTVELRIPAAQFAQVLETAERVGKVTERNVSGQDVTEEFVDLQARIRNLERHEHQLLTFMDRATKVADLLAIEQELARVRGEIEHLTGRLRFVANRVELATLEVTLRERTQRGTGFWDFTATIARIQWAFLNTVRQIFSAAEGLVVIMSGLVPLALLAVPSWILIRRAYRRHLRPGDEQTGQ